MKLFHLFIAFSLIVACYSPKNEATARHAEVSKAEQELRDIWVLHWMEGVDVNSKTFPGELPRLELNPADSSVVGFTGCNHLTGNITCTDNGQLSFGALGTTRMYCEIVPEPAFLDYLTKTNAYSRDGLTLWLLADGKKILGFKKVD